MQSYITEELAKRGQLKPEFANSVDECTDTSLLYVLPDGYIYGYILTTSEGGPTYTNLADPASENWLTDYRLNSSGVESANAGTIVTNYIPCKLDDVIRVKGLGNLAATNYTTWWYDSDKGTLDVYYPKTDTTDNICTYADGISMFAAGRYSGTSTSKTAYLRITGVLSGSAEDVIITVNEEIKESEAVQSYQWGSTGHAFVPADYEERIIELEEDVITLKNEVRELGGVSSDATIAAIPSYWESMVTAKTEIVKALQTVGGKECVSFAWASDTHIPDNDGGRTTDLGKVMAAMLDSCEIPFAVLTGDINTRASYGTEEEFVVTQEKIPQHLAPLWGTDRLLVNLGNHDGCWGDSTGYYRHQFTPERMWQMFFRGQALDFRRVFSDDGLYYYVDNVAQKTRFIVLNSHFGGEYEEDENGWSVNNRFGTSCYGQAQLDWLANVALDMPDGYGAIITAHVPPNITYTVDKELLIGIVDAYCNKATFNGSYTAGIDGWSNSAVSVDFTAAKGEIIAMFTGHVHADYIDTETLACPLITITAAGATSNDEDQILTRTSGTDQETSFDVVTINRATRTIYCTRVGAGSDREISY